MNLSKSQIKQLTNFINLKEVKQYIEENRADFEKWLLTEEGKKFILKNSYIIFNLADLKIKSLILIYSENINT